MSFGDDLRKFARKSDENAAIVHKKVAIDLFSRVIARTPVDTGRLRGNWQAGVREYAAGELDRLDPSGGETTALMVTAVSSAEPHAALTLTNNLPYARRIEYDNWSQQAPAGMVRVSVAEFQGIVKEITGAE
ncbi:MAG: HK97 gp10 family phage protein [Gammaproteobacteria bacterium]|nr:HK97 gp10 family phage protein [Gammaproteobacteria bacterium]